MLPDTFDPTGVRVVKNIIKTKTTGVRQVVAWDVFRNEVIVAVIELEILFFAEVD